MTEADTIVGLVRTTETCGELAGALRDEIALGEDSWDKLRGWFACLDPGLPSKARMLVALLARLPYTDLPALVAAMEAQAVVMGAGEERAAV